MKGQVLGFDGQTGAISGEDGQRYNFTKEDWKDERPPTPRDQVDFVAGEDRATEIYRLKAAFAVSMPEAARLDSDHMATLKTYAARPQLVLAIILIFASLFLTFISTEGDNCCIVLTEVHSLYSGVGEALEQQEAVREQNFGSLDMMSQIAERQRQNRGNWPEIALRVLPVVSYLLWLIPAGAALIAYHTIRQRRQRRLELATGLAALLTLLIVPLTRAAFSGLGDGLVGYALSQAADGIGYGFGAFAIGVAGTGLVLTGLNRLTRTPGL